MFGLGFRPPHYKEITESLPKVDFFEIVSENFMEGARRPHHYLEMLCAHYPVFMHGVSLSIGSHSDLDTNYLRALKNLADYVQPRILSDHLSWSVLQGRNSHDLLPTPYTFQSLDLIATKVQRVQDFLGRRLYLENPSAYVAFRDDEIPEPDFLRLLCEKSGCGILLDINNLYVNSQNLGLDARAYLHALPQDAIGYFHLAGHSQADGVLIDTHDHPVRDEVWTLFEEAVQIWPQVPTLIEWDGNIPSFARLQEETLKARYFHQRALAKYIPERSTLPESTSSTPLNESLELAATQAMFFRGVVEGENAVETLRDDVPVPASLGLGVYQNAYGARLLEALTETFPTLAFVTDDGFADLVSSYLRAHPPSHFSIGQAGKNFATFLRETSLAIDFGVPQDFFADLAAFEWAQEESFTDPSRDLPSDRSAMHDISPEKFSQLSFRLCGSLRILGLSWPVAKIVEAVSRGETPPRPEAAATFYLVARPQLEVIYAELSALEFSFLRNIQDGKSFVEALPSVPEEQIEELAHLSAALLNRCFDWEIVSETSTEASEARSFIAVH